MITVKVFPDRQAGSKWMAAETLAFIEKQQQRTKFATIGTPTGNSPATWYSELVRSNKNWDFVRTVAPDEYLGLPPGDTRTFRHTLWRLFHGRIAIPKANIHVPSGTAEDAVAAYEQSIRDIGGIHHMYLGIGHNGHIGFNEPGSEPTTRTRVVELSPDTRRANAAAFGGNWENVPTHAITIGIANILECDTVTLMAWGANKAESVRRALEGRPSAECPASWLQLHHNCTFVLDEAAASLLTHTPTTHP